AFRYRLHVTEYGLPVTAAERAAGELVDPLDAHSVSYTVVDGGNVVGELRVTSVADVPDSTELVTTFALDKTIGVVDASRVGVMSRLAVDPLLPDGAA